MKDKGISILLSISILFTLVLLGGLSWALKSYLFESQKVVELPKQLVEEQPGEKNTQKEGKFILALGDSLTRGTGDPTGKGYIGQLIDELQSKSKEKITLSNMGIKGQTSAQLLSQIKEKEIQRQMAEADYILLTIGGNDLFQQGQTLVDPSPTMIEPLQKAYLKNLREILQQLRTLNKDATIFMIGLYNPFSYLDDTLHTSQIVREWNYQSSEVCAEFPLIVYVPTFDLFQLKAEDYLYSDKFHPNGEGYRLIAERVASLINW
ncbi:lysophospholipase L1-like esterase/nitrogen fixation-related uncharacterized protein [Ammoniphilus resinae]|uniref:Lysophospholipase L1-like esterase/nitrogen fixation-related uncharacterized protein n=1 Tax=Ammoniphilus resinae TaxID=861532 RepID=A0ABS4GKC3_9BACL|nr:lysophospholipase L1-like esterase/nitrogen fixation-related uncharacterized protein [Ammoniphilus resinae]